MANIPKHRALPSKEQGLFKELLTQYELKQYKKGIKAADTILKKFPNHGETLALKALTLHSSLPFPATVSSLPKQEEAEAMARTAVKKDITSHITWHVLGILAKVRKDWEEAARAFAMARKQDADNIPLLRDSIALYLHTRQYSAAVAARHHLLLIRPNLRSSWLGLIVAHHLNGDPEEAVEVFDGFERTAQADGMSPQERSQLHQYVIRLCVEAGDLQDALRRLESGLVNGKLHSRGEITQLKAEILAKMGKNQDAEDTYRALLEQNPDNLEYYRGFLRTKGFDVSQKLEADSINKILSALDAFSETYPKSSAPRRLALDIAQGDEFRSRAKAYLIAGLERGVPSLFVDVKGVYTDAAKMSVVGEILEETVSNLEKDVSLHNDDTVAPPTALLWAYYFFALHLSHPSHPNPSHQRSLDLLEKANQHTPTLPEIYMAKARVLKRAGDPLGAAEMMEEARLLDGQDRFLNGKAAKYWLRAGEVKKATDLIALFTKKDMTVVADLTDLQCLWFLQEEGDAYKRTGNLGLALKRYQTLATVFQEYEDDQYDFHTYCMRRMTFSYYVSLMRFEDQLRSHPAYFNAAREGIEIYLRVYDQPDLTEEKLTAEEEAERKKAAKKAQKAEQKAKKAALANSDGKKEEQPVPDDDPTGIKALKTETPLEDALKLWKPLAKLAAGRVEVQSLGYEIYARQGKWLAAVKCLAAAKALDPENARVHSQILSLRRRLASAKDTPANVQSVLDATLTDLIPSSKSSEEFNNEFLSTHGNSPAHILSAARGVLEIKRQTDPLPSGTVDSVSSVLDKLVADGVPPHMDVLLDAVTLLRDAGASEERAEAFGKKVQGRVPLARGFESAEERKKRREEVMGVHGEVKA